MVLYEIWNFNGPFTLASKYLCNHYINFSSVLSRNSQFQSNFVKPRCMNRVLSVVELKHALRRIFLVSPEQTFLEVYVVFVYKKTGNVRIT